MRLFPLPSLGPGLTLVLYATLAAKVAIIAGVPWMVVPVLLHTPVVLRSNT